jgi:hypothetical protein
VCLKSLLHIPGDYSFVTPFPKPLAMRLWSFSDIMGQCNGRSVSPVVVSFQSNSPILTRYACKYSVACMGRNSSTSCESRPSHRLHWDYGSFDCNRVRSCDRFSYLRLSTLLYVCASLYLAFKISKNDNIRYILSLLHLCSMKRFYQLFIKIVDSYKVA